MMGMDMGATSFSSYGFNQIKPRKTILIFVLIRCTMHLIIDLNRGVNSNHGCLCMGDMRDKLRWYSPEDLYRHAISGERSAWDQINSLVFKTIKYKFPRFNDADKEDFRQIVLSHLFQLLCGRQIKVEDPRAFIGFLHTTTVRKIIDLIRVRNREKWVYTDDEEDPRPIPDDNPGIDPSELHMVENIRALMLECFNLLGDDCKAAIRVYCKSRIDTEDKLEELADQMGENLNTIVARVRRCFKHFRDKIYRKYGEMKVPEDGNAAQLLMHSFMESLEVSD